MISPLSAQLMARDLRAATVGLALWTLTLSSGPAFAASFDCEKASTEVERMICADPLLGALDVLLSANYRTMRASNIGDGARDHLQGTQRTWLTERNLCSDRDCLVVSYRSRIEAICDYPVISGVHPGCLSSDELEVTTERSETPKPSAPNSRSLNDVDAQEAAPSSIITIADAQRLLGADNGMHHVVMPLLNPDNLDHQFWGQIVEYDSERRIIIARVGSDRKPSYFAIIIDDHTTRLGDAEGRINGVVSVVGQYIDNQRILFQPSVVVLAKYIYFE